LIPFLNSSYQRKQARIPVTGNEQVHIAFGLSAIHHCLSNLNSLNDADYKSYKTPWNILNKNSYGYLVEKCHVNNCHDLKIGDFIGIFEPPTSDKKTTARVSSIRWLRTDPNDFTKTGLETIEGEPIAVQFSLDNSKQTLPALLLPEMGPRNQAATLITAPGIFSPQQTIHIKTKKKHLNFTVVAEQLLESNADFERFTFTDKFD